MFGATFLVPILTGFDPSTTLFFTAMSTALFLLINRNVLPSYLGSSFGFIAPITAVSTANKGIAVASFGIMVTGILLALVGVLVHYAGSKWIDIIMPPVVNGAIVAIIGFNLAPSVWTNFGRRDHRLCICLHPWPGRLLRHRRRRMDRLPEVPPAAGRFLHPSHVHPRCARACG